MRSFALFFDLHYLGAWNRLRNSRRSREGGQKSRQTGTRKRNLQWNFIKFRGEVIKLKAIEFLLIAKQIMLAVNASWLTSKRQLVSTTLKIEFGINCILSYQLILTKICIKASGNLAFIVIDMDWHCARIKLLLSMTPKPRKKPR